MKLTNRNGIFYISYVNAIGKQIRFSTNTKDKKLALDIYKNFQTGNFKPQTELKKDKLKTKSHTVHYLVFQYLKHGEKHFTPETMVSLKSHLKTLLNKTSNNLDIMDLDFYKLNEIVNNQVSVYQSLQCRNYYNMFFNWLINNGYFVGVNPVSKIKKPKIVQKLPVYISELELQKILQTTTKLDNMDIRDLVRDITLFAFYTGFRLSEITSLIWSQVDFSNKTIKLDNQTSKTKSGKIRVVPISNKILDMLEVRYNNRTTELVFSHNYSMKNFNDLISKSFKKCVKKLPEINQSIHFHSLRHSFASNLVLKNVNILTVSKLLGHSKIATTLVYSHISDNVLKDAINVL